MKSWTDDHPRKLQYELVKKITNNFSDELGRGTFGRVFKGLFDDGEEVAVKVFHYFTPEISDQQFQNEFDNHKKLKHPNIVGLLGFCDETEEEIMEHKGRLVVCYRIRRALCLEYVPNGSLGKFLSGGYLSNNWPMRYKIIKGICKGLQYLHNIPIFHFDLKPDNILLDENMLPKITDFGLSRLIGEGNTKKTMTPLGTNGYLPPEFINFQIISREFDIYSLGVIIMQIINGFTGYYDFADMEPQELIKHVHDNWKRSLEEIPEYVYLEADCKQVKGCMEIAINCTKEKRHERPRIKDIISKLDELEHYHRKRILEDIRSLLFQKKESGHLKRNRDLLEEFFVQKMESGHLKRNRDLWKRCFDRVFYMSLLVPGEQAADCQLLRVLDLEGCSYLKNDHLREYMQRSIR